MVCGIYPIKNLYIYCHDMVCGFLPTSMLYILSTIYHCGYVYPQCGNPQRYLYLWNQIRVIFILILCLAFSSKTIRKNAFPFVISLPQMQGPITHVYGSWPANHVNKYMYLYMRKKINNLYSLCMRESETLIQSMYFTNIHWSWVYLNSIFNNLAKE